MDAEVVVNHLISLYREKKIAHAYLIETNNITKCYEDVKKIIKGICCKEEFNENCTKCNICHLIDINNLPSFITIEPDGKNIKKEVIEYLKKSFSHVSMCTINNFYVIKYPEKMNDTAFNKMLKFLEEPEDHIIGFLITNNKDDVANTIISRCEILKINYKETPEHEMLGLDPDKFEMLNKMAIDYSKMIDKNDKFIVWYNNSTLLKGLPSRNEVAAFLRILFNIYFERMNDYKSNNNLCIKQVNVLAKYLEQLNFNVNTSLLLDSMVIELGELNGK